MERLTVLYDATCALCVRCRDFLEGAAAHVRLELVASQSTDAKARFGAIPVLGQELVVVSDEGDVWLGPAAFLVCLWSLREWREWSYRLSGPELAPLAERFFVALSSQRRRVASFFSEPRCDAHGECRVPHARRALYR